MLTSVALIINTLQADLRKEERYFIFVIMKRKQEVSALLFGHEIECDWSRLYSLFTQSLIQ